MVDVKTEERHAHEHEILLGKYENGNMNLYCKNVNTLNLSTKRSYICLTFSVFILGRVWGQCCYILSFPLT
jgi:hypothetical protein